RSTNGLMEVPLEIVLRPSGLGERARVLGPHHQHRVGIEREVLAVPEARHRPAQRPAELTRGAARVIGDAVRRVAGEQRDGGGPGRQAAARVKRWAGGRVLALNVTEWIASG